MQLTGTVLRAIEETLKNAERKPADAALREVLRVGSLSGEQRGLVSRAVFTYFRWLGWLDRTKALRGQLEHAFDLAIHVETVSDADLLARALPAWVREVMQLSAPLLRELQREPRLWLRARPGRAAALAGLLGDCEEHPFIRDAVWYYGPQDLFRTPEFHAGEFEIQDLSSQIVGLLCAPKPGETWWDACAGEGGKMLHLCDLMANKGLVWASDPAGWRLDLLKRRASRAKLFNYRLKEWTRSSAVPVKAKFDGILIDAPCSGLGTWGRNPHARWTTQLADVVELAAIQKSIVGKVAASLKPGGKLIYSVCTLTRQETSEVADTLEGATLQPLALAIPGKTESSTRILLQPAETHSAGMFIAGWTRV